MKIMMISADKMMYMALSLQKIPMADGVCIECKVIKEELSVDKSSFYLHCMTSNNTKRLHFIRRGGISMSRASVPYYLRPYPPGGRTKIICLTSSSCGHFFGTRLSVDWSSWQTRFLDRVQGSMVSSEYL